jgi:N-acetylglucosaminyl-diphospho-decaprenol L-rhamnosyltransferase
MPGRLGIVVVNYRTPDLVIECLQSLSDEVGASAPPAVVVVENGSGDGSAGTIAASIEAQGWSHWVSLLPLANNRGFSAGSNAGIRLLLQSPGPPDYFLLLNPDTVVRAGALAALLDFTDRHPKAGIIGSRLEGPDGVPHRSAFRFHSPIAELEQGLRLGIASRILSRWAVQMPRPESARKADWVSGASILIRREVLESVGLLDEGYFLYFEEVDFCLRAARAGWECWHEPRSRVVHLGGQATGVDLAASNKRFPGWLFESRRRYFIKNHGPLYALLADLAWLAGHLIWLLRSRLLGSSGRAPPMLLRDFLRHSVLVRGFSLRA